MKYVELPPEENTFSNIMVDITHKCNMECANCYIPNRDIPDMDLDRLYDALKRLPTRTYIRLVGAEPTMHPNLADIISMVKKLGHRPSVTTNGLKLANMKYLETLRDAGLRLLLLSMNGADEDHVYRDLDNGNWATVKVRALRNIMKLRLPFNTGTIIARDVNPHSISRQIEVVTKIALELGINFDTTPPYNHITPVIRMKSVGVIGRNMGGSCYYPLQELAQLTADQLGIPYDTIINSPTTSGVVKSGNYNTALTGLMIPVPTEAGTILLRFTDWGIDDDGVVDGGNPNRGRLTEDFKIAPFFEHVKLNEFGY